jgi:hypothetical protein
VPVKEIEPLLRTIFTDLEAPSYNPGEDVVLMTRLNTMHERSIAEYMHGALLV